MYFIKNIFIFIYVNTKNKFVMNHKIKKIVPSFRSKYTAEIMDGEHDYLFTLESPVEIGEHPQLREEMDKLLGQIESAKQIIWKHFLRTLVKSMDTIYLQFM